MNSARVAGRAIWLLGCSTVSAMACAALHRSVTDQIFLTDAFDVIGEMTFGRQLGFLQEGRDVDNIMSSIERMLDYAGTVSKLQVDFLAIWGWWV